MAQRTSGALFPDLFGRADANGKRHRAAGETDQATWTTAYMGAADERMKALRCY